MQHRVNKRRKATVAHIIVIQAKVLDAVTYLSKFQNDTLKIWAVSRWRQLEATFIAVNEEWLLNRFLNCSKN